MLITDKVFKTDIEKIKRLLNRINLLKNSDFHKKPISTNYRMDGTTDFSSIFKNILENNDFHFLLKDQSIIQIEKKDNLLRYTFYGVPFIFSSYEDYLIDQGHNFSEVGYSYQEEYNQKLYESELKKYPIYLRYDYSEEEYKEFCHGVSHLHIGLHNDMRITACKELTPLAFLMIILKNFYYNTWKEIIDNPTLSKEFEKIKSNCPELDSRVFNKRDKKELYLS